MKRLLTSLALAVLSVSIVFDAASQCAGNTTAPTYSSCPGNITLSANAVAGQCYHTTTGAEQTTMYPVATDDCSAPPLLVYELSYLGPGGPGGPLNNPNLVGTQFPVGTTFMQWRVLDPQGNSSGFCNYQIIVNDVTAPVITCGATGAQNVNANGTCKYVVSGTGWDATATDNCTLTSLTYSATGAGVSPATGTSLNGAQFNLGTTVITWTATDNYSNTSTCSFTVIVTDVTPPVLTCINTTNQSLNTDPGQCTYTKTGTGWNASATDNCSVTSVLSTLTGATTATGLTTLTNQSFNVGVTTVTWTATDGSGNTTTCTFDVTVTDNVAPVVTTCPSNQTVNMNAGQCTYTHAGTTFNAVATDNCAITYSYALTGATILPVGGSTLAGQVFNTGTTNVLWTITDVSGNIATCTFDVTVVDNQNPQITCGVTTTQNVLADAGVCTYTKTGTTWNATATDNCLVSTLTCDLIGATTLSGLTSLNGVQFNLGTTTVTWTATDNFTPGNTSTCSFQVIVTDDQDPVLTCTGNQTVNMDPAACTYTKTDATWNAPATDNCTVSSNNYVLTGATTGTGTTLNGIAFNYGLTTVTWTATDNSGNTTTCSFTVTVNDNQSPVITCTGDHPVNTDATFCTYTQPDASWDPTISDNCPTTLTYALSGATIATGSNTLNGETFNNGVTVVTWTLDDSHGNIVTCSQTITVTDVEVPVITQCGPGANTTVSADAGACDYTNMGVAWDALATDNCGVATIAYNISGATTTSGSTSIGGVVFNLGTSTVEWTITDVNGNTSTCTYDITVNDTELPVITCNQTSDVSLPADLGGCTYTYAGTGWDATANDNCGIATVIYTLTGATTGTGTTLDGVVFTGLTNVLWTATDVNGNTSTCSFNVLIQDTEIPTISCVSSTSVNTDAGACTYTNVGTGWDATGTDNCTITFSYDLTNATTGTGSSLDGVAFNLGTTTVTWTVTDGAGNTATCSYDVTVTDIELPVVTLCGAGDQTVNMDASACTFTQLDATYDALASDNCTVTSINYVLSGATSGTGSTSLSGVAFNFGATQVDWTITDNSGNTATCSYTITVVDNQTPVITCTADQAVNTDAAVCTFTQPDASWDPTISDNCPTTLTYALTGVTTGTGANSLSGVVFNNGATVVTWTLDDSHGNVVTCSQTITVSDLELPLITCNQTTDVTLSADAGGCTYLNNGTGWDASGTDNCGVASVVYNLTGATTGTGTTLDGVVFTGLTNVEWTATDVNGNTSTCSFNVLVIDTEIPTITCVASSSVTADPGVCTFTNTGIGWDAIGADNCTFVVDYSLSGATTGTGSTLDAVAFNLGTTNVLWTVTDGAGNTATCTYDITVTDNELPVITCAGNHNVSSDAAVCNYTHAGIAWDAIGSDNCTQTISYVMSGATSGSGSTLDGVVFNGGITSIIWTSTDGSGNTATCTQTIEVDDIENPVITTCGLNADQTVIADAGVCTYTHPDVTWDATATDNCNVASIVYTLSGATTGTGSSLNGVVFNLGLTNVLWTVTDDSSNVTTCTYNVTVNDAELPVVTSCGAAGNQTVSADAGVCSFTNVGAGWDATGADNCSISSIVYDVTGATTGNGVSLDGFIFNSGTSTVLWTITDGSGNTATCTFDVTVNDTENPVISTCGGSGDVIVVADAGVCDYTLIGSGWDAVATDNCAIASVQYVLTGATTASGNNTLDGLVFNLDTTNVLWTITDLAGNTSTCSFNVIVQDDQDPVVTCVSDQAVNTDAGVCTYTLSGAAWDATSTDNCSSTVSYALSGATSGSGATLDGVTFNLGSTTVTWVAIDAAGNTDTCIQTINVTDIELPVVVCHADSTVSTDSDVCTYTHTSTSWDATGIDNCTVSFAYDLTGATTGNGTSLSGVVFNQGATVVTWTATDGSGNTVTCSFTVTVNDTQSPSIDACGNGNNPVVSAEAGVCTFTYTGTAWNSVASDNCAVASLVYDLSGVTSGTGSSLTGVTFNLGITTVTWTATDNAGNTVTCSYDVTVNDTESPVVTTCGVVTDTNVVADAGVCTYTNIGAGWDALGTDNCSIDSISYVLSGSTVGNGLTTLDGVAFNNGTTTVAWTVTDGSGNTATCQFDVIVTDTQAPVIAAVLNDTTVECSPVAPVAFDNCGPVTGISDFTTYAGDTVVVVTWTFTDAAGNTTTSTQTITYDDVTAPDTPVIADAVAECDTTVSAATTSDLCMGTIAGTTTDPLTYSAQGTYTITWTFDDTNGNTTTATQTVIIQDVTAPTITAPATVNVLPNNAGCTAIIADLGTAVTNDNCQVVSVVNDGPGVYPLGATTVTWTVTDIGGNTATAVQTVNVLPLTSTVDTVACDVYISPDGIDLTPFGSGTYTAVIPGSFGCDSTITINLTLNQSTTSTITLSSCDTYTAPDGAVYNNSGVYTAIIQNAAGCDSTITINLTIDSIETVAIELNDLVFSALQATQVQYQWVSCDNGYAAINGATQQNFDITQYPLPSGNYAVILTNNTCVDTSNCVNVSIETIVPQLVTPNGDGNNDVFEIQGVYDYPNNILEIYNRWGSMVYRQESYQNTWGGECTEGLTLGGDILPAGTYFYIFDKGQNNSEKPVKGYIFLTK